MNAFTVLTEFRFDVGSAVLQSEKLQGAVEGVSQAANEALFTFQKLSMGIVAQFTGGGGLLGILGTAVQATDKFKQSQLALANVLGSMNGGSFVDRMKSAEDIMTSINKKAREFALPAEDLLNMTKLLGPMLGSKGLAGPNLSNAVDMSRMFLKSAPTLGIDPGLATGQLMRSMEGGASMNDTLFTRLTVDTKSMKEFFNNTKAFNALAPEKRIKVLTNALKEFSSDANVLDGIVNSLTGQMQLLKNNLVGAFSILRPLGDALTKPLVDVMARFNKFLAKDMAGIIKNLTRGLEPFLGSAEDILITTLALKDFKKVINFASTALLATAAVHALAWALNFLGVQASITTLLTRGLAGAFGLVRMGLAALFSGGVIAGLMKVVGAFSTLGGLLYTLLAPAFAFVMWFEILGRAIDVAKINSFKALAAAGIEISDIMARFSVMMGIINQGITGFATTIAPLFEVFLIKPLIMFFDLFSKVLAGVFAGIQGLLFGIFETVNQIKSFFGGKGFNVGAIKGASDAGANDMFEKIFGKIDSGEGGVVSMQQNIGSVNINQDFKEQMEPDRVAFTVAKTLTDIARNPTQAQGRGFGFSGTGNR